MTARGKTIVITGATAGIGQAAAVELARRGAQVVLVARNPEKAKATTALIEQAAPGATVRTVHGDLASMASARAAAGELVDGLDRIDVLVNNAGISAAQHRETNEGYDEMLAANYLGPFLLTHLVLPKLRASTPARIVVVASEAHRAPGRWDVERFEDVGSYSGALAAQLAYGRTKLFDLLFANELARRLDGEGITVNSLCPGLVATSLARESGNRVERVGLMIAKRSPFVRTPEQGARMTVRLADADDVEGVTGRFFSSTPGASRVPAVKARRDPQLARRLYERTCGLLGIEPVPGHD
jgi:NAD(P)-dependent dehydrogenase (short-subunit alcohol dehydrogenase family)